MEYFKVISDRNFVNGPKLKDWYGKINTKHIRYGYAHTFPKRMLLYVQDNPKIIFTDYVSYPFVLVSDKAKKVISMYDKNIPFTHIVLLEDKHKKMQVYNLPFLHQYSLVRTEKKDDIFSYDIAIDAKELKQRSIFQFIDRDNTVTVMRLDLLESLLRRRINGFMIEPIIIHGIEEE